MPVPAARRAASFAALLAASQAFPVPARLPASRRGATVIAPQHAGRRCVDVRMVEGVGLLERLRLMRNKGSKSMSRKRLQNRVPQRLLACARSRVSLSAREREQGAGGVCWPASWWPPDTNATGGRNGQQC